MDLGDGRPVQAILQKEGTEEEELMGKPSDGTIDPAVGGNEGRRGESDGEEKGDADGKEEGAPKKKKGDRPQTEEEVMAEFGRKKAATQKKAARVRKQKEEIERKREEKKEEMERRRDERERKKQEKQKEREDKKRRKQELLLSRKPKSRAESSRRTKSLLASRESCDSSDGGEEADEEYGVKKKKKRTYVRKNATPRGGKNGGQEGGTYIANPCEYYMENVCTTSPLEEFSDVEMDTVISVPALFNSKQDKLPDAMGSINFDDDESMQKHLHDMEEVYKPLAADHKKTMNTLDGMKLNLFGETMFRKFDPRVIHNIENPSTESTWPVDMCPRPNVPISKYRSDVWKFTEQRPFPGVYRVRPLHRAKDVETSHDIDVMSGCVVPVVTKKDLERNVDELIRSKLRNDNSWRPVPSAKNPFDVPEVSSRKRGLSNVKNFHRVSYVDKKISEKSPDDGTKKRKRTMREVLMEHAQRTTTTREERQSMYKDGMEEEGEEEYEAETGEMLVNPSRTIGEMDHSLPVGRMECNDRTIVEME